jgi:hypothetical protein
MWTAAIRGKVEGDPQVVLDGVQGLALIKELRQFQ